MIKGRFEYMGRNVKYKVYMENIEEDYRIVVKSRLGKKSIFNTELIIDKIVYLYEWLLSKDDCMEEYEIKKNEFLNKWNSYSSKEIKDIAEGFIKNEIDTDTTEHEKNWNTNTLVKNFNNRKDYEGLPKAPRKIPMPECKKFKNESEDK